MTILKEYPLILCIVGGLAVAGAAVATPVIGVPATSVASPQRLGTPVTITANATDSDPGTITYRFQIGAVGGSAMSMVRDFSVGNTITYTPTRLEGSYKFVVTARNNSTGKTATNLVSPFRFTTLVVNGVPVVTPTANALVALFSSPPCPSGDLEVRASILQSGLTKPTDTNWEACKAGQNVNLLIGGMRATTTYIIRLETSDGKTITQGQAVSFTTGTVPVTLPAVAVVAPLTAQDDQTERYILLSTILSTPMAVDLSGHTVWYYPNTDNTYQLLYRTVTGGEMLMLANGVNSVGTSVTNAQVLREIDLAGNTIRETNASRIAEQVSALSGIPSSCQIGGTECIVGAFHHEATQLPNGHTLILTDEEKIFTDGTQGSSPANPVDIMGDIIVDLDTNWQVSWYWRAFDHLDANRAAVLGEVCPNSAGGCPPIFLTTGIVQDWLHSNALYYTPSDGSILLSMRHQDWVDKIDYGNGTGTGDILWTLGKDGDFAMNSSDPYPWFSHQHDPGFVQNGTTTLALFDNGNTRVSPPPLGLGSGDSRGYVLNIDQANKVVTPVMLADLGYFSMALGTAELLANGDYHFNAGWSPATPPFAESIEVFPDAQLGYTLQVEGTRCYRSMRLASLYSQPSKD